MSDILTMGNNSVLAHLHVARHLLLNSNIWFNQKYEMEPRLKKLAFGLK